MIVARQKKPALRRMRLAAQTMLIGAAMIFSSGTAQATSTLQSAYLSLYPGTDLPPGFGECSACHRNNQQLRRVLGGQFNTWANILIDELGSGTVNTLSQAQLEAELPKIEAYFTSLSDTTIIARDTNGATLQTLPQSGSGAVTLPAGTASVSVDFAIPVRTVNGIANTPLYPWGQVAPVRSNLTTVPTDAGVQVISSNTARLPTRSEQVQHRLNAPAATPRQPYQMVFKPQIPNFPKGGADVALNFSTPNAAPDAGGPDEFTSAVFGGGTSATLRVTETGGDTDPDNAQAPLTVEIVNQPAAPYDRFVANGSVITFDLPASGETVRPTSLQVEYRVRDVEGLESANSAIVTLNLPAREARPLPANDSFSLLEDETLTGRNVSTANEGPPDDLDGLLPTDVRYVATSVSEGTLDFDADTGQFNYTPSADFNGQASFSYVIESAAANGALRRSAAANVTFDIAPQNDAPVAVDDEFFLEEADLVTPVALDVLNTGTDTDIDNATADLTVVAQGALPSTYGTVSLNGDATGFVYTAPAVRAVGTRVVTFRYRALDPAGGRSMPARVTITVPGTGIIVRSFTANDDAFTLQEDTTLTGADLAADNGNGVDDLDGATLADVQFEDSNLTAGALTLDSSTGLFDFTPPENFVGDVTFTYQLTDSVSADTATVTISVLPVNDPPVAVDQRFELTADQILAGAVDLPLLERGQVSDVDDTRGSLTVELIDGLSPARGTLSTTDTATGFIYTPPGSRDLLDTAETVTFTYQAVDDDGAPSPTATATIVLPAKTAVGPAFLMAAEDDTFTIEEDTPLIGADIKLANGGAADDFEGAPLSAVRFTALEPAFGQLTFDRPTGVFDYVPGPNENGPVTFEYTLSARDGTSADTATVTINVTPVNDAPMVTPIVLDSVNDLQAQFAQDLADPRFVTDVEGDTLNVSNVVVTITSPIAVDADTVVQQVGNSITIVPDALKLLDDDENALITVQYDVDDGSGDPAVPNTLTLTVVGTDNFPTRQPGAYATTLADKYSSQTFGDHFLGASEANASCHTCHLVGRVAVDVDLRSDCQQTPAVFNAFGLEICLDRTEETPPLGDLVQRLERAEARFAPSLVPVPAITIAESSNFGATVGTTLSANPGRSITGAVSNIQTYLLGVESGGTGKPSQTTADGQFSIDADGQITVATNDLKPGTFNLTVLPVNDAGQLDGNGNARPTARGFFQTVPGPESIVTIIVTAESPVALADQANTTSDAAVVIDVLTNDEGGNPETFGILTQPTNGTATIGADRAITYTPTDTFVGTDQFTYEVGNSQGTSNATVTIEVLATGTVLARSDETVTTRDRAIRIDVLANDINAVTTGADATILSLVEVPDPATGQAAITGTQVTFTPATNFIGTSTFRYRAQSAAGGSLATVRVQVLDVGTGAVTGAVSDPKLVSVAQAFDDSCGIVNTAINLTDESSAFLQHCVNLTLAAQAGESLDETMRALRNEEHFAVVDMTSAVARGLGGVVSRRLERLRNGPARGFDVGGVSLTLEGERIPTEFVTRLGQAILGVAPADSPSAQFLAPSSERNWGMFISGDISYSEKDSTANARSFELTTTDVMAGVDSRYANGRVIGFALGYSQASTDFAGGGSLDAEGYQATVYGLLADPNRPGLSFEGYVSVGRMNFDSDRRINFTANGINVDTSAQASFNGTYLNIAPRVSFSQALGAPGAPLEAPLTGVVATFFASLDYLLMDIDGYRETGGNGLALDVQNSRYESLLLSVGAEARRPIYLIPNAQQEIFGSLSLSGELLDDTRFVTASFAAAGAGGPQFTVEEDGTKGLRGEIEIGTMLNYRGNEYEMRYGYTQSAGGLSSHRLGIQYSREVFGQDRLGVGVSRNVSEQQKNWEAALEYELRF